MIPNTTPETTPTRADATTDDGALERILDDLMAQPIKARPAITVLGDEHVFAIHPPKR